MKSKTAEYTIFEDKFQMPAYTTFQRLKGLVSYSKFPFKNGFLDKAYSPRCNTHPFLPIHLHHRKRHLRKEDHRAPALAAAATTVPMSYCRSP